MADVRVFTERNLPHCETCQCRDMANAVVVEIGEDNQVRCAKCKAKDYPLQNHVCNANINTSGKGLSNE